MNDMTELLSQLRDIHEPEQISTFPMAPGWWLLLVLMLLLTVLAWYLVKRKRNSVKRMANRALFDVLRNYEIHRDKQQFISELSMFLRRVVIKKGAPGAAKLAGEQWLSYLDEIGQTTDFMEGPGRILANGPYQSNPEFDEHQLIVSITRWVSRLK